MEIHLSHLTEFIQRYKMHFSIFKIILVGNIHNLRKGCPDSGILVRLDAHNTTRLHLYYNQSLGGRNDIISSAIKTENMHAYEAHSAIAPFPRDWIPGSHIKDRKIVIDSCSISTLHNKRLRCKI